MERCKRVLMVEDSPHDAELFAHYLSRACAGTGLERVEYADDLRAALGRGSWDLIVLDANVLGFGVRDMLQVLREEDVASPVIVLTGDVHALLDETMRTALAGIAVYSKNDFVVAVEAVRKLLVDKPGGMSAG